MGYTGLVCSVATRKCKEAFYQSHVEASIKTKSQLYCHLLITQLLSKVVGPAHLEAICNPKGIHWTAKGNVLETNIMYWQMSLITGH